MVGLSLGLLGAEVFLRIRTGTLFEFATRHPEIAGHPRVQHDPDLGWIPMSGRFEAGSWTSNVTPSGLRVHESKVNSDMPPLLVVGDSFAFGDEVSDHETWPAQLQERLGRPVINAGVGAYGVDQAVLRAEKLLAELDPELVLLSFISDDISRVEYQDYPYGRGPKPYFVLNDSTLELRNTPVPSKRPDQRRTRFRRFLGHSCLFDLTLNRLAPEWWRGGPRPVHQDGNAITVALLGRLKQRCEARGASLLVIPLACGPQIGDNARLPPVIQGLREKQVEVLDLATEAIESGLDRDPSNFRPGGHYSPTMNDWVAEQIVDHLDGAGR